MSNTRGYAWPKLASVQIGGAICLPVILMGYELASLYGGASALVSIAIGNILLAGLAIVSSSMIWKNKKSTSDNAGLYFGTIGKNSIAVLLACTMCGWFAVQTQILAKEVSSSFEVRHDAVLITLSTLFAALLLCGFRGIAKLANIVVPLTSFTLIAATLWAFSHRDGSYQFDFRGAIDAGAISLVMALAIGVLLDMPTFFREAATKRDCLIGALVVFLVGIPAIEASGVLLYAWGAKSSLIDALGAPEVFFWDSWIILFLLLACSATNTANLYSAAMGIQSLTPKWSSKKVFMVTAAIALITAQIDFISHLAEILGCMGVLLASGFGVILMSFIQKRESPAWQKIAACIGGAAVGLLSTFFHYSLPSGVAVLDGTLFSMFITSLGRRPVCKSVQSI